ncbi:hypothetical protein V6N11_045168 [Hibiscus sabdariffa]|uniref:Uncharacterized protein n=2 Tax=Hibiscus sabdariffa TaxID=183260 RepID=A0ABR2E9G1_9ROSI
MFSFNHMGHALLSFSRKDQGDLGTSLSFSRKDRRDLASPCSVSIVWDTLCYPSAERTKFQSYGHALLSFSRKDQGDLGASLSFSRKDRRGTGFPIFSFNRMEHALLFFSRKDQGDLGASLSFGRKDRRSLASPFSVSIVWGTLCYSSAERTKLI